MTEKERFEAAVSLFALMDEDEFEHPYGDPDTDSMWNLWLAAKADAREQDTKNDLP